MIHRINVFLLSIILTLSQVFIINSANANNVGGWTLGGGVAQGASVVYNGTKQVIINGADYIKKGTAKITPNAAQVAKVLRGGGAAAALGLAVGELLGAVDWVLDPSNNQIVYKDPSSTSVPLLFRYQGKLYSTSNEACQAVLSYYKANVSIKPYEWDTFKFTPDPNPKPGLYAFCNVTSSQYAGYNDKVYLVYVANPNYDPEAQDQEKSIPLETVAQQVISNAAGGDTHAQVATTAAAADIVAEAEKDNVKARPIVQQLEQSATTENADSSAQDKANEATGESKPNTETGGTDLALEFPAFCGWAPTVCEAAQTVISFPQTLTQWWETSTTAISDAWTSVKEWVKPQEVPETDTKVEIEAPAEPPVNNDYLKWNAYCPFSADSSEISLNGESSSIDSDLTSWCTMASELRPFVILAGAIASLMIVSGVGIGRGED